MNNIPAIRDFVILARALAVDVPKPTIEVRLATRKAREKATGSWQTREIRSKRHNFLAIAWTDTDVCSVLKADGGMAQLIGKAELKEAGII